MSPSLSEKRTKNYIRQLKGSFVFKALAVGASFLAIPIMIHYLGQEMFGVWSTLLSIVSWVVFFDLGIGNGLRNKLAESLAKNEKLEASKYVSSGYTLIALISVCLFILVVIASFFVPWQVVFNTVAVSEKDLRNVVLFTAFVITFNFWIGLINQVLNALQKTSIVVLGQAISNMLALLVVYILSLTTKASLLYLAMGYGFSLVVANVLLSLWFYGQHTELLPKPLLKKEHVKPLLSLGGQFFIIQLAVLVIFTTDKILITQLFGPEYVTQYDVVFKLFGIITLGYGLISAPLWSAYTDAYHRGDIEWIKRVLQKQMMIFGVVVVAAIILIFVSKNIIGIWIGSGFQISMPIIIGMGLFVVISVWNNVFGFVLGGINKIRLGSLYTVVTAILNIPLSYYFAIMLEYGLVGIIMGTIASISISAVVSSLQVYYFIYTDRSNNFLSRCLR